MLESKLKATKVVSIVKLAENLPNVVSSRKSRPCWKCPRQFSLLAPANERLHYENTPIQIYGKYGHQKLKVFIKILIFFIFLLKTEYGYTQDLLEQHQ